MVMAQKQNDQNSIESPEIDPRTNGNFIYDKNNI